MQQKAILLFDPDRRPEQMAFAAARTTILHQHGNNAWVEIDAAQADRHPVGQQRERAKKDRKGDQRHPGVDAVLEPVHDRRLAATGEYPVRGCDKTMVLRGAAS